MTRETANERLQIRVILRLRQISCSERFRLLQSRLGQADLLFIRLFSGQRRRVFLHSLPVASPQSTAERDGSFPEPVTKFVCDLQRFRPSLGARVSRKTHL